jgi:hypothetical protein
MKMLKDTAVIQVALKAACDQWTEVATLFPKHLLWMDEVLHSAVVVILLLCCPNGLLITGRLQRSTFGERYADAISWLRFPLSGHLGHCCSFSVFIFPLQLYASLGLERLLSYGVLDLLCPALSVNFASCRVLINGVHVHLAGGHRLIKFFDRSLSTLPILSSLNCMREV